MKRPKAKGPEHSGPNAFEGARIVRAADPAGMLPDGIAIRDLDKITPSQRPQVKAAIHEYMRQHDPRNRIARVTQPCVYSTRILRTVPSSPRATRARASRIIG